MRKSQIDITEFLESLEAVAKIVFWLGENEISDNGDLNVESAKLCVDLLDLKSQTIDKPAESHKPNIDWNDFLGCHDTEVISP